MRTIDSECRTPFLKALGDKTRWRLSQEQQAGPEIVSELTQRLKVSRHNVPKQLRILGKSGIVETVGRGKNVDFRIVPDFQRGVAKIKNQFDLGCRVFRFDDRKR